MNELAYVRSALLSAAGMPDKGSMDGQIHKNRSQNFVKSLANLFRQESEGEGNGSVAVLPSNSAFTPF